VLGYERRKAESMRRRTFLARSGRTLVGSGVLMSLPAAVATWATACSEEEAGRGFLVLTDAEAADIEAIAARILPSDDSPGATEAGVVHFIDAALSQFEAGALAGLRSGLAELQAYIERTDGLPSFTALAVDRQIEVLEGIDQTDFFGTLRYLTLAGMFSHPSYGGNRDEIGWRLIGFDAQGPTPPPFGYYDAEYNERGG